MEVSCCLRVHPWSPAQNAAHRKGANKCSQHEWVEFEFIYSFSIFIEHLLYQGFYSKHGGYVAVDEKDEVPGPGGIFIPAGMICRPTFPSPI